MKAQEEKLAHLLGKHMSGLASIYEELELKAMMLDMPEFEEMIDTLLLPIPQGKEFITEFSEVNDNIEHLRQRLHQRIRQKQ